MSYSIKGILRNIRNNKDVEKNLCDYANVLTTSYNQYAMFAFSMNYYILYQSLEDEQIDDDIKECIKKINDIVKKGIVGEFDGEVREKCINELDNIRNEIVAKMDTLADYAEKMLVYDYVIYREKYRFDHSNDSLEENEDDRQAVQRIFNYMVDSKDKVVLGERIREVLSLLPMRMAKTKFFDLMNNTFTLFKDSEISSVESYVYRIRSAATIYESKGHGKYYTELGKDVEKIGNFDYDNITKESCNELFEFFNETSAKIEDTSEIFYSLQEVINLAYAMLLTRPYVLSEEISQKENELCFEMIAKTCEYFDSDYQSVSFEKEAQKFELVEGCQERFYVEYSKLESELDALLSEYTKVIESTMIDKQFECLKKCEKLLSTSLFTELEVSDEDNKKADDEYIKQTYIKLEAEFKELFANSSKHIRRAIMANVVSKFPVFFSNTNEVREYIENAFDSCRDIVEKRASVSAIDDIIADELYFE